ncbi:MAG: hypothetical protein HW401_445 [Parcubacteria group bacterium]|nr:hypothetical protein [Parcubacteria group bacterium]
MAYLLLFITVLASFFVAKISGFLYGILFYTVFLLFIFPLLALVEESKSFLKFVLVMLTAIITGTTAGTLLFYWLSK